MEYIKNTKAILLRIIVISGLVLLSITQVSAQDALFKPQFKPVENIGIAKSPINVDGDLSDPAWQNAKIATGFSERHPGDNVKPSVETLVLSSYDDVNIYFAFICKDNPDDIRATMSQRDRWHGNDAVSVQLDTYGEAAWAYELYVNPYGIQRDYMWTSVHGSNSGFDLIWYSAAQITDSGYQVEIAIPFTSLRFPDKDVQTWRIDFRRDHPRETFRQYSWAAYDRDEQCAPCQWGTVNGIKGVYPGKGLEIMPSSIGYIDGGVTDYSNPDKSFENDNPVGEMALMGKYRISSSMTLEAALNPDFSQIEGDAAQININSTVAFLYPERRPFFQEGNDLFRTMFNSFNTRMVNDPSIVSKLILRKDQSSFAFLTAYDETSPYIIPLSERSQGVSNNNAGNSVVNVARGLKTFGNNSQVGFMLSDRRYLDNDGSGSIAAVDGVLRLDRNYSFRGQYILSHTTEPNDSLLTPAWVKDEKFANDKYTVPLDGESYTGWAFITQFRRFARKWSFVIDYNQVDPTYRTQLGWDPWNDYRNLSGNSWYTFRFDEGLVQNISPSIYLSKRWNYNGGEKNWRLNTGFNANLNYAQINLGMNYSVGAETWAGIKYPSLAAYRVNFNIRPNDAIGLGFSARFSETVVQSTKVRGDQVSTSVYLDLKPIDRITIEPSIDYVINKDSDTKVQQYEEMIGRVRLQLQATRELSVRLVAQFDDYEYLNSNNITVTGRAWDFDPLITYRLSPFSVLYVGSTHDWNHYKTDPYANDNDDNTIARWDPGYKLTNRQYFVKLQYMLQI